MPWTQNLTGKLCPGVGDAPTESPLLTILPHMTDTGSNKNRECVGQGVANFVTGFSLRSHPLSSSGVMLAIVVV